MFSTWIKNIKGPLWVYVAIDSLSDALWYWIESQSLMTTLALVTLFGSLLGLAGSIIELNQKKK